jgi:hypothetical protein
MGEFFMQIISAVIAGFYGKKLKNILEIFFYETAPNNCCKAVGMLIDKRKRGRFFGKKPYQ